MASPRLNEPGLWPRSNDTLPVAMSLQKEAFHVVAAFLEEGLEADLGGLVDVLTMMTTSRLADRRPMLRGIGMKFQRIADTKLDAWITLQNATASAYNEACAVIAARQLTEEDRDDTVDTWNTLHDEWDRVGEFFDCCKDITGRWWDINEFHDRVLTPTFAKWMRL